MANSLRSLFQGCAVLGGIANVILVYLAQPTTYDVPQGLRWLVGITAELLLVTSFLALSRVRRIPEEGIGVVPYVSVTLGFMLLWISYGWLLWWRAS